LAWVNARFGERAAIASSFGVEDTVLIDLAARHAPKLKVFTLDTGRLHPETYEILEVVRKRYEMEIEVYAPEREATEKLVREKGAFSFRQGLAERLECCRIRKVEPLERALRSRAAWVTGLRREQSPTRTGVRAVEVDAAHGGIAKINPLAAWTEAQIWAYVAERGIPYHSLHDRGFRSIGCAPCTRAIRPYEDVRAGRWWWEQPEHKECGLHPRSAG
ncbi:MAG TPA: phosphoadenylyl-sulfate reductase, partial [Myxococcaceae bacterium]|nr:phosphoadenylyl-sulfate reductase [Myxococcaceae bacterium]